MGIPLREYVERMLAEMDRRLQQRFEAQERANSAALVATKEALTIALASNDKSAAAALEANRVLAAKAEEFADQKLQTHNNIRPWVETLQDAQVARLETIERASVARDEALATRDEALDRRIARFENRELGMSQMTKFLVGAVGVIGTIVAIYFAMHR